MGTLRAISKAFTSSEIYDEKSIIVQDAYVNRARNAVSHFYVNSASTTSPSIVLNKEYDLYMCGDWIDRCSYYHSSWSTEKSVVTALQAVKELCKNWDIDYCTDDDDNMEVIP